MFLFCDVVLSFLFSFCNHLAEKKRESWFLCFNCILARHERFLYMSLPCGAGNMNWSFICVLAFPGHIINLIGSRISNLHEISRVVFHVMRKYITTYVICYILSLQYTIKSKFFIRQERG